MPTDYPNGTRLRCAQCGREIIILKAEGPDMECCGEPMEPTFVPTHDGPAGR
jgi:hypothetical protein